MVMAFEPGWKSGNLTTIPSDSELARRRAGLSNTQQKAQKIHPKDIAYAKANNEKRRAGLVYLSMFNESHIRMAVIESHDAFSSDPDVRGLFAKCIGKDHTVTIDQGTHQVEDHGAGYRLHFDARRPSDGKCFHIYVGQHGTGSLKITSVSYMNGGSPVEVVPTVPVW